jgi:hypothetical protein
MMLQSDPIRINWLAPDYGGALLLQPLARAWLEDGLAVADIGIDLDDLRARIAGGEFRVVMIQRGGEMVGVIVLEISWNGKPAKKTLSILVAGGRDLQSWLYPMHKAFREIAATHNCERLIVAGRPGWERALRHLGWKKTGVILEIEPQRYTEN